MAMDIFTSIFERIDNLVSQQIAGKTAELMTMLSPLFLSGFIIYVMLVCWSYWANPNPEGTMIDLIKRIMIWGVIIGFSINIGAYNSTVVPIVLGLGDGLSQAFSGHTGSNASALDALAGQIVDLVVANKEEAAKISGFGGIKAIIDATLNNAIILISSSVFLVIAAAYIILVKIFLAILAVIGPLFIACALFPMTRQFAMAWVNQVLNYSLLMLFVNIAGGFFIAYVDDVLQAMGAGAGQNAVLDGVIGVTGMVQIVLATLVFVVILLRLPDLASGLAGGITGNGYGNLINNARMIKQLGGTKGGGGKTGGSIGKG